MSGYRRFVSYIYGYDQGEKKENTGFVKVNARGGECKIWVHMRGFYARGQKPYRVYAFTQRRDRLEGQYLGELESRNGALEWSGVTDTESLNGGFGLEESRGIFIEGSDRVYAAEWDDYPVEVERFQPVKVSVRQSIREDSENTDAVWAAQVRQEGAPGETKVPGKAEEPVKPQQEEETESRQAEEDSENTDAVWAAQVRQEGAPGETKVPGKAEEPVKPQQEEETESRQAEEIKLRQAEAAEVQQTEETESQAKKQPEDGRREQWNYLKAHFQTAEYQDGEGRQAEAAEVQQTEETESQAKKQPEDGRREQWNYLKAHFQTAEYQDGEGKTLEGIRLGNRELSRIPRDRWGMGNNSFLLHGFYQHHHLLLLRAQTDSVTVYYIGVPGIYNEKEQMLASMFGFEEFKLLKKRGEHGGGPGYWCRLLK